MRKIFLNATQIAGELGISQPRVHQLGKAGILNRGAKGYDLAQSVQAYVRYRLTDIGAGEANKLMRARLRKIIAQLEHEKILLQKVQAETMPIALAKWTYEETRKRIFAGMKKVLDIVPQLEAAGDDRMEVFRLLDAKVHEILTALSQHPILENEVPKI